MLLGKFFTSIVWLVMFFYVSLPYKFEQITIRIIPL